MQKSNPKYKLLHPHYFFREMAYPISSRISTPRNYNLVLSLLLTVENRLSSCHYSSSISLKYGLPQYGQRTSLNRSEKPSGIGFLPAMISGYSNSALQSSHLYTPMRLLACGVPFIACRRLRRMPACVIATCRTNHQIFFFRPIKCLSLAAVHAAAWAILQFISAHQSASTHQTVSCCRPI